MADPLTTLNVHADDGTEFRVCNPTEVELYVGALEAYETFTFCGTEFRLPAALVAQIRSRTD